VEFLEVFSVLFPKDEIPPHCSTMFLPLKPLELWKGEAPGTEGREKRNMDKFDIPLVSRV
jgi:hypothetical protein